MADNAYKPTNTRWWWTGTQADLDAHIEKYQGKILGSFETSSDFRTLGLTDVVSVENETNTYRIDRIGGAKANYRRSGETIEAQRAVNEKHLIVVEAATYVRHTFDWQDDWTSPSAVDNVSREQGRALALDYDKAHIIQLIKAGKWTAPQSLKDSGNYYDGITLTATGYTAEADKVKKAILFYDKMQEALDELIMRDLRTALGELVWYVNSDVFSVLTHHPKLTNRDFDTNGHNNFVERRIAVMDGIRVIETSRFPRKAVVAGEVALGDSFTLTAAEAKARAVLFHPGYTLQTVEAKGLFIQHIPMPQEWSHILDSGTMYTVGLKRGDACAVVAID